jgi:Fic family protein
MKEEYKNFMLESNKIEGEGRLNPNDVLAVKTMLISELNKNFILIIHQLLGEYLNENWVGKWRTCEVRVGSYFLPVSKNVPALMKKYFKEVPTMDAWTAHNEFEKIHPFQDLNGRVGRLIWLKKAIDEGYDFSIPFLQAYYYQTLNH